MTELVCCCPCSCGNWLADDKDNKYHLYVPSAVPVPVHQPWFDACLVVKCSVTDLTPQTFYRDMVPFDANEFVSLINDPRNEYQKLYTVDRLGNIVGGTPVAYINVPIDTIRKYGRSEGSMGAPVCTRN